jgi:cell division transport system ATP-binding protein
VTDENQALNPGDSRQFLRPSPVSTSSEAFAVGDGAALENNTENSTSRIVEELLSQTTPVSGERTQQVVTGPPIAAPTQLPVAAPPTQIQGAQGLTGSIPSIPAVSAPASPAPTSVTSTSDATSPSTVANAASTTGQTVAAPPEVLKLGSKTAPAPGTASDSGKQPQIKSERAAQRQAVGGAPVILFDGISKVYPAQPNKPALNNISLRINAGEFIFLVGHSGSGKSTFIRLISRELVATRGRLTVAGEDVIRMRNWRVPYLRRNIGCVFQDFKLLPNKTAFENVAFALEVIGKSRHIVRTQVPEVLRLVGLEDKLDQYPDQLSGGEQQRVSIARAIVNRPPLLICDEPTGNLDPQTSLGIMRLLDRINRTGTTILVATHDREMVDSLRKRVVTLENGYLVRDQEKGGYGIDA